MHTFYTYEEFSKDNNDSLHSKYGQRGLLSSPKLDGILHAKFPAMYKTEANATPAPFLGPSSPPRTAPTSTAAYPAARAWIDLVDCALGRGTAEAARNGNNMQYEGGLLY